MHCCLLFLMPQKECLYSGKILIGQIRLEPVIGQWDEEVELKVLERGKRKKRSVEMRQDRERDKVEPEREGGADSRGLERPQVTRVFINWQ